MTDVFKMSSPCLPKHTRVVGFRGSEGISRPYAFETYLSLGPDESADFELSSAVGAKATLTLDRQDGRLPFAFHGILCEAALVHHQRDGLAILRAVLVPRLWRLTQTLHSRLYTNLALPDILRQVIESGGLTSKDYTLKLTQPYEPEEHVCQYGESDLDFLARWMEREGVYYFFEQDDDGEKLIIADDKSVHEVLAPAPIRFFASTSGDVSAGEHIHTFVCRQRALPASVRFKDYDYGKPGLDVSGQARVSKNGAGEIHVHGARFFTPGAGERLAKLRAEELLAREVLYTGSGSSFFVRAGYTFELQDHPRASFDTAYLATEVEHFGNQSASTPELRRLTGLDSGEVYRIDITAIPASVQFRAETKTPWPRIYGTEHGVVDGPADSEYAQLDEHGRYAVRFAFDESDLEAGKASTRVRMMQPHGGGIEGWHFPLRKGTEVLLTFLGGDPDRPVIAGVVPNALTPSPVSSTNHTKNVIQTGGRNRLEIEDRAGQQRITLSTPHENSYIRMGAPNAGHNMIVRTDGRTLLDAGQDWDVTVGGKHTEYVALTTNQTYQGDHVTQSWATRTIEIGGAYTQNAHASVTRKVYGSSTTTIDGSVTDNYGSLKLTCGAVKETLGPVTVKAGHSEVVVASALVTSDGPILVEAPSVTIKAPDIIMKTGKWWKHTPVSVDVFGTKDSVGLQSFAAAYISVVASALKLERSGTKVDISTTKADNTSLGFEQAVVKKSNVGTGLESAVIRIMTAGLTKIG